MALLRIVDGEVQIHSKWEAAGGALRECGGIVRVMGALMRGVPAGLGNGLYDFIAKRRYRWFGKGDACEVFGPDLQSKLLS